jgi:hypothetical protein
MSGGDTYADALQQFGALRAEATTARLHLDDAQAGAAGAARSLRLASDAARVKPELLHLQAAAVVSFEAARDAVTVAAEAERRAVAACERQVVVMSILRSRSEAA